MQTGGKHICEILKGVRKKIADANGIDYSPCSCNFEGDCRGTCAKCEEELSYLERQIGIKQRAGQAIKIIGLASGLVSLSAQPLCAQTLEPASCDQVLNWDIYYPISTGLCPRPEDIEQKEELVNFILSNPSDVYMVVSHTDGRGSENYNVKLSQKRAEYICAELKRITEGQNIVVVPIPAACYEPRIPNAKDEAEHEQNRAVTIETYRYGQHKGKVGALVEYGMCKEMEIAVPKKIERRMNFLNALPYGKEGMAKQYDKLAEMLHALRKK